MYIGLFGLVLFIFFYFGSGSSSSSDIAILIQNIWLTIICIIPSLFGFFKYRIAKTKDKAKSYLYSGLFVSIISGIYFTLLS